MLPCFCGTTAPNLMAREALFLLTELYSCKTDVQLGEGAFGSVFTAQRHSDRQRVRRERLSARDRERVTRQYVVLETSF